jgi:hypothetical protein
MDNEPVEPVTPGPWETSEHAHAKAGTCGHPEKWRYVQHNFPEAPYEGELSDEWGVYPPLGEAGPVALVAGQSNARLIAKAPEMLDLLKKHLRESGCDGDLCSRAWHEEFLKMIRSVEPDWPIR